MYNELAETYKDQKIEIYFAGYGAGKHIRVLVNRLEVTSQVPVSETEPSRTDLTLIAVAVRKLIDAGTF